MVRNARGERIEDAVAAGLLACQDRAMAAAQVEAAERDAAAALLQLGREKVSVRDMATLIGIGEPVCARLLKLRVKPHEGCEAAFPAPVPVPLSYWEGRVRCGGSGGSAGGRLCGGWRRAVGPAVVRSQWG